jgi:hypothetical protein
MLNFPNLDLFTMADKIMAGLLGAVVTAFIAVWSIGTQLAVLRTEMENVKSTLRDQKDAIAAMKERDQIQRGS